MMKRISRLLVGCLMISASMSAQTLYHEVYRPQIHFSPQANWMNDPNGMVYYQGTWHLFFQYYPGAMHWGPMHWGHATSKDLVHWQQQPVALYPDSLGFIFSGSAVVDPHNTSGFGKAGQVPLVAIFTQHDTSAAKALTHTFQNQSIAYSLDSGRTWIKYADNPVLKNPGIDDFRDPKVMWYAPGKEWIMTLAAHDRVLFYASPDLKNWEKAGEFDATRGAHGGVWECPDLFLLDDHGKSVWVLVVNINPGGPNGGSATQYFTGTFNGHSFTPSDTLVKWLDFGPDEYAGVTWSGAGDKRIMLGWMSNWVYANQVPTSPWRSANTLPRLLSLQHINGISYVCSMPIKALDTLVTATNTIGSIKDSQYKLAGDIPAPYMLHIHTNRLASFSLTCSNDQGEKVVIGFDKQTNRYYLNRAQSGNTGFSPAFGGTFYAPRIATSPSTDIYVYADASSFELFADGGLTVMTGLVFPQKPYNHLAVSQDGNKVIQSLTLSKLKSIWE